MKLTSCQSVTCHQTATDCKTDTTQWAESTFNMTVCNFNLHAFDNTQNNCVVLVAVVCIQTALDMW